jgi:general secretion pathway protein E
MNSSVATTQVDLASDGFEVGGTASLHAATRIIEGVSAEYLEHYALLPVERTSSGMRVATWLDEPDRLALDELRLAAEVDLELVRGPERELRVTIRRVYGDDATARDLIAGMGIDTAATEGDEVPLNDLVVLANEAPVVKLVNLLVLEALEARASDIHLEGYTDRLHVRYRIDGVLQDAPSPPAGLSAAIVSRLKIMADLDIAERRQPQDGRIRLRLQDRSVDVRVSTLPALRGESVVLRLLDKEQGRAALPELGMADDTMRSFSEAVQRPHGIVLATGPTGSGKTTTLYAAVDLIRTGREKILTVEDPVEYELPGVPQIAVNEKVGLTFATALRALLRQDPDVMLVGEIRDGETAEIATQAALTGHLVLSTLHTNDASGALTRLLDLGVQPFLVASTVEAVLAQRLVRKLCKQCVRLAPASDEIRSELGFDRNLGEAIGFATGCPSCRGTGYHGRTGLYELLIVHEAIRAELTRRRGSSELRRIAIDAGMRTLRDDGARLVLAGITTAEEVLRVTRA